MSSEVRRPAVAQLASLLPFLRPYRWRLVMAFIFLCLAAGSTLTVPIAFRQLIDHGFAAGQAARIDRYFLALFGVAAVLAVATALRFYSVSWLGERVVTDLRQAIYAQVLLQSPVFFETTRTGEVLSRLTTDTTLIQTIVGTSISMGLRNLFLFAGGMGMLLLTSAKLFGITVGLLLLVVVPIVWMGRRVRRLSRDSQDRIADASALAGEVLNAMTTVQAFGQEAREADRFRRSVERSFTTAMRRITTRAWLTGVVITLVFGAVVFVLWLGAKDVVSGVMSPGTLAAFVLYAVVTAGAVGALTETWGDFLRAAGAMERLSELLEAQPEISDPAPARRPQSVAPHRDAMDVEFGAVTFHYPSRPHHAALDGFSLTIAAGETIALVGPSGAGKSTVFQLLLRFYDPQSGQIRLGGEPLGQLPLADLRARIGIVPQDSVIFSDNALENIRYGNPAASDEAVMKAAELAQAHEFIKALPEGYQTHLGERGVRLSGGQRQRLAIARALLKDPPILLLDEATSALDAESEFLIQRALEKAVEGRTTLIIAHRLSTVKNANRIIVMDNGRIVDVGSHSELMARGGLYARLASLQLRDSSAIE